MKKLQLFFLAGCFFLPFLASAQVSGITEVSLTFTPKAGGDAIVATAVDNGQGLAVSGDINLVESTEYSLSIGLSAGATDLVPSVQAEDTSYLFYFAFSDDIIVSPAGDGNIDMRADPMNYDDADANGLPIGLSTSWETECVDQNLSGGGFRLVLAYQAGTKSSTSTATDGSSVIDLTWTLNSNQDPDAPPCENEEEIITDVTLTFTSVGGGDPVTATAQDPDGPGPLDLVVQGDINLVESTEYTLTIELLNSIEGEDITVEIMEEDAEHMFFFAFTDSVIQSPAGDGNIDNRDDPMNYNDFDENGFPVGLSTNWETSCGDADLPGTFRVVLKHQPDIKSATSTAADGESDIDLTWNIVVEQDPDAPPCENEEEIITDVNLTFTPVGGGDPVTASAQDPDGPGPLDLVVGDAISLLENTEYTLSIELLNSIEGEDITEEIMEEDAEHMFFFGWTDGLFSDPAGDGNVDNRDDAVNYNDFDGNSLPVGLSTQWTTGSSVSGDFRVVLKHQPDIKSATSTVNDGDSDIDLTFSIGTTTSVDPSIKSGISLRLWPNPAQDALSWTLEGLQSPVQEVVVQDLFGRVVLKEERPSQQIDIQSLATGNYIFLVRTLDQFWVKRFIKEN